MSDRHTSCKQAVANATEHGYACYDLQPGQGEGHVTVIKQGETYDLEGRIDGVKVNAESSEDGLDITLQELNINPRAGWYSL
jgi:hypothetical protein